MAGPGPFALRLFAFEHALQGRLDQALEAVLQSVAEAVDGDRVAVVEESVGNGGGEDLVAEDLAPLAEAGGVKVTREAALDRVNAGVLVFRRSVSYWPHCCGRKVWLWEANSRGVDLSLRLVEAALDDLAASVRLRALPGPSSHTALAVSGVESPEVARSLGRVLVGLLLGAVRCNVSLAAALLVGGADDREQLAGDVIDLIGANNSFVTDGEILFRDTKRNAWLAEGLLHVLLVLQNRDPGELLGGRIHALRQMHPIPTQQGFDAVALYVHGDVLSLAIGESKASRLDGSGQLTQAAKIFKSLDSGDHLRHLRQELMALEGYLAPDLAGQVANSVLKQRCYVPSIVHESPFDARRDRVTLKELTPPHDHKRLLVIRLQDFHGFFDSVADAMREAVAEIVV